MSATGQTATFFLTKSWDCPPKGPGGVKALDLGTGNELWRADLFQSPPDLNLLLPIRSDGDVVVAGYGNNIVVLDAHDGRQLWQREGVTGARDIWPNPTAIADDSVYVAISDPDGSTALESLEAMSGVTRWHASGAEGRASVTADDRLVVVTFAEAGTAMALDPVSGARLWEKSLPRGGGSGGPHASATIGDGVVYFALWGQTEPITGD